MQYSNSDQYKGNWINNKKNGKGIFTILNGDELKGNWENDIINGILKKNIKMEMI